LIQRSGFDQIADGLGLRQIDAAVQVGTQRELPWFRQPHSSLAEMLKGVAQNHGRSMAGDFDHIFRGIRTRCREVGYYDLIDNVAIRVWQSRQSRGLRLPSRRAVRVSKNTADDRARMWTRNSQDT